MGFSVCRQGSIGLSQFYTYDILSLEGEKKKEKEKERGWVREFSPRPCKVQAGSIVYHIQHLNSSQGSILIQSIALKCTQINRCNQCTMTTKGQRESKITRLGKVIITIHPYPPPAERQLVAQNPSPNQLQSSCATSPKEHGSPSPSRSPSDPAK